MKPALLPFLFAALLCAPALRSEEPKKADPPAKAKTEEEKRKEAEEKAKAEVQAATKEALGYLAERDWSGYMARFFPPDDYMVLTRAGVLLNLKAEWDKAEGEKKEESEGQRLARIFRNIQGKEPKLSQDLKEAVFAVPEPDTKWKPELKFAKIGDRWYLAPAPSVAPHAPPQNYSP
jgi:hypothetical protein